MDALKIRFLDAAAVHAVGMPKETQLQIMAALVHLKAGRMASVRLLCDLSPQGKAIWAATFRHGNERADSGELMPAACAETSEPPSRVGSPAALEKEAGDDQGNAQTTG